MPGDPQDRVPHREDRPTNYPDPRRRSRARVLLVLSLLASGCAHPRHLAVVADSGLYQAINDIHIAEQTALCGQASCAGIPPKPIPGWSVEKSLAFNKKLLPAAEAGRQLNHDLSLWQPGQPIPTSLPKLIEAIGESLTAITFDFPDGTTRTKVLQDISEIQQIVITTLNSVMMSLGDK